MVQHPVPGDLLAPADPHVFVGHDVVQKRSRPTARLGWPLRRMCRPTDIIFGWLTPSRYSMSKPSLAYVKKSSAVANTPRPNFESFTPRV